MIEVPETRAGASLIPGSLQCRTQSVGLVCNEVWGGNRAFYGPIELPGMRGVLFSQPCGGSRGGDVHYLSVCGSGLISRACLADVTGHGESVAAVSQSMHDLLRRSVNRIDERKVLRRLNLRLLGLENGSFATAAVFTYFPPTRRLSISYAGHEPAWYYTKSTRTWSQLDVARSDGLSDIPLAVERKARYTHRVRRVAVGDRLLMITDGVLEVPNDAGELFGRQRLGCVLQDAGAGAPEVVLPVVIQELHKYTQGAVMGHDDVSMMMVEFVDNLQSPALWTALRNRLFRRRGSTIASGSAPRTSQPGKGPGKRGHY